MKIVDGRTAGVERCSRHGHAGIVPSVLAAIAVLLWSTDEALSAAITIAGNGPELRMVEQMARAFEKKHLGAAVEIRWDPSFHPTRMVKSGEADLAVVGESDPDLVAIPIAWDGIAVVVDFTNPVREITTRQLAAVFSGTVTRWSEVGGSDASINVINRSPNQHTRTTFETVLGIIGKIPPSSHVSRSDQRAISSVVGKGSAVTYASLGVALDAVTYGVGVALLSIDQVEPAKQTVRDGRYCLRRPVLLLRKHESNPTAASFVDFSRSKEAKDIIEEMFVSYTDPETQPHAVHSSMREK
ncbi:MAG TPA: substrate-binding domain-containing protein [Nitrospira sp.]|nr:substrate-binding domain-containing protein [Nitrospira sp.]